MGEASSAANARSAELQRLTIAVDPVAMDRLSVALVELAPGGWNERFADPSGPAVDIWVPVDDSDAAERWEAHLAERGVGARVSSSVESGDWVDALRRHHQPIEIGGRLMVRPPWVDPVSGLIDVVIDPGMAFGTGQHATTKGCLTLLLDLPNGSLLDVGCGSGVLAIAARKLGHEPVWAIDNDPLAVEATTANAAANGVDLHIALATSGTAPLPRVRTIMANLTTPPVMALAAALPAPAPEVAILSGLRPYDVERVQAAWAASGYEPQARIDEDDWSALRLVRA